MYNHQRLLIISPGLENKWPESAFISTHGLRPRHPFDIISTRLLRRLKDEEIGFSLPVTTQLCNFCKRVTLWKSRIKGKLSLHSREIPQLVLNFEVIEFLGFDYSGILLGHLISFANSNALSDALVLS